MPKTYFQDEKPISRIQFFSDLAKTIYVDPETITFEVKAPDGTTSPVTPVSDGPTGYWRAEYVVDQYGTWEWRWETDNPRIVAQGEIWVIQKNVD